MRLAIVLLLCLAGCEKAMEYPESYADLACETAYATVRDRSQEKDPPPKPASDKCENCDGTGKIGDGRIVHTCPECKGTGKKLKSVVVPSCPDGKCPLK